MIPRHKTTTSFHFDLKFETFSSNRAKWQSVVVIYGLSQQLIIWYTHGSPQRAEVTGPMGKHTNTFQAEIYTIDRYASELGA